MLGSTTYRKDHQGGRNLLKAFLRVRKRIKERLANLDKHFFPTNNDRASWAGLSVLTYSEVTGEPTEPSEEHATCVANLIGSLGHYCDRNDLDYLELIERGVGMWSAESRAPDGDPYMNDNAIITIEKWKAQA